MQTVFDAHSRQIDLVFESPAKLRTYLGSIQKRGLLLVRLPEPVEPDARISVRLTAEGTETGVECQVHQVFRSGSDDHGIALKPLGEIPAPTETICQELEKPQIEPVSTDQEPETRKRSEVTGASIAVEIRRMNVSQRLRLASKASRLERQVLLRDNSPQVLMGLLTNPRIDEQEVRELVRSPYAASGVLQHVAKDRRWSNSYEIRLALVKSPKTPTPLAQRLLPTLRKPDLQALAKSPNVREAIKGAALRLYLGKM